MALKKQHNIYGVKQGEYWKVCDVKVLVNQKKIISYVEIFESATARLAGDKAIIKRCFVFDLLPSDDLSNKVALAYNKIKADSMKVKAENLESKDLVNSEDV